MKVFEAYAPSAGNVGFYDVGHDFIPSERELYESLLDGIPLPKSFNVQLDGYSKNKIPTKDFVSFGPSIVAADTLDARMKAMIIEHCHTIALIASFGDYTYYIPKNLIAAVDWNASEILRCDDPEDPSLDVRHLVIDASKLGDIPIFQLAPEPLCETNYVTDAFVKLYKECRCQGLRFIPIDTTDGK